jgi:hypothetical protein
VFDATIRPLVEEVARLQPCPGAASADPAFEARGESARARRGPALCDSDCPLARNLDLALRALNVRRGRMLPFGATPERAGELALRWTFAVLVASLLDGIATQAKAVTPVETLPSHQPFWWLMRVVPSEAMVWLMEAPEVVDQLEGWLGSDAGQARGPLADIMRTAIGAETREVALGAGGTSGRLEAVGERYELSSRSMLADEVLRAASRPPPDSASSIRVGGPSDPTNPTQPVATTDPTDPTVPATFLRWLRRGVRDGSLPVNGPKAAVICVREGLLLVSPVIFRAWLREASHREGGPPVSPSAVNPMGSNAKTVDPMVRLQRRLLRHAPHWRGDDGATLHTYICQADSDSPNPGPRSGAPPSTVTGIVLLDAGRWLDAPPPVDPSWILKPTPPESSPGPSRDSASGSSPPRQAPVLK